MNKHTLGDAPIDGEFVRVMNDLAKLIDRAFNGNARGDDRAVGFVLLMFPFGEDANGRVNYISNGADRKDIAKLFREQANLFDPPS